MKITLSARSKILELLDHGKAFRIQATGSALAGSMVDLVPNVEITPLDSTILIVPLVVVDIATLTLLSGRSIDFDFNEQEFIISKRGHE